MTPAQEEAEILRNARGACEAKEITPEQERDVWTMVSTAELAALRDAKLIATHLLIDIQTFFNSEVKVCNGIGCEFEIGMLDSISAYLDSHGTEGNIKGDE